MNHKINGKIEFLKTALKDYKVGAIAPSSKYVVSRVLKELQPEDKFIVEYGAGDGVITKEILKIIPEDGRLIALEINPRFVKELEMIQDPRFSIRNDDVRYISAFLRNLGLPQVDLVISGIPFLFLNPKERKETIENTYEGLKHSGRFIVYQTSLLILPILKRYFEKVRWCFEPRNLVPYFIMVAEK